MTNKNINIYFISIVIFLFLKTVGKGMTMFYFFKEYSVNA